MCFRTVMDVMEIVCMSVIMIRYAAIPVKIYIYIFQQAATSFLTVFAL